MNTLLRALPLLLTLLAVLAPSARAQLDPVLAGRQVTIAPAGAVFETPVVASDLDGDGLPDLLSAGHIAELGDGHLWVAHGLSDGNFATPEEWPIDKWVEDLDVADVNGDGRPDAVLAKSAHFVVVLYGKGDGSLHDPVQFFVGAGWLNSLALADIDRNGQLDFVTVATNDDNTGELYVNLADGAGGYLATQAWPLPSEATDLDCGDLDGDGWPDVVVTGHKGSVRWVLLGDGAGGLLPAATADCNLGPVAVSLGDLDGDGDLDAGLVGEGASGALIGSARAWINDGAGDLSPGSLLFAGEVNADGLLHDVDADGDLDLVVLDRDNHDLGSLWIAANDGAGNLAPGPVLPLGLAVAHLQRADVTGAGQDGLLIATDAPAEAVAIVLPARTAGALALPVTCGLVEHPLLAAIGDLDLDGWPDALYAAGTPSTVATLFGSPDGLLPTPLPHPGFSSLTPYALALGDLTGDGLPDAVEVGTVVTAGKVAVGPGTGDGSFSTPMMTDFSTAGASPERAALIDTDADGWRDVVLLSSGPVARLDVFRNEGAANPGHLETVTTWPPGPEAIDFAPGDLDGDGVADAVVARQPVTDGLPSTLAFVRGDGQGAFAAPVAVDLPAAPDEVEQVRLADFDLDGRLDAVVSFREGEVVVATGDGAGGFLPGALLDGVSRGTSLAVADFDGDGWPDVVHSGSSAGNAIVLRRGDGAGGLLAPDSHATAGSVQDLPIGDMDLDGKPDVVAIMHDHEADGSIHGHVRVYANLRRAFPWTDLGSAKAGSLGEPRFTGTGSLQPGSPGAFHLAAAAPDSLAMLVASGVEQPTPWKGGVLVPLPTLLVIGIATDGQGHALVPWSAWPLANPGATWALQLAIRDPPAPQHVSLSNALRATEPD